MWGPLAIGVGPRPQPDTPHAFAVLFAQSLMMGAACLALSASSLGLVALAMRFFKGRRDARGLSPNLSLSLSLSKP